jgi:signal transduction histidine kinase
MKSESRPLVLIVDDVPDNIEVLAAALGEPYEISFACSGAEGIAIAESYPPDLVLLDVMMPGMNGFETCRRMRANEVLRNIPVIFISALEDVDDKVSAFQSGGNDYVTKPFQVEEVAARVATHIALYRTRRELCEREVSMRRHMAELEAANRRLLEMGNQLLQAEKQAAIGQLAAGVAHEINNPLGFISSNLNTLAHYAGDLLELVDLYSEAESQLPVATCTPLAARRQAMDLAFLREDVPVLLDESKKGMDRVRVIVRNLLDFSRTLDEPVQALDLHAMLDETLAVTWNELNPTVELEKQYGKLPLVDGMPTQIAQVFSNLLRNALQSMPDGGHLKLSTECVGDGVAIIFKDSGCGIAPEIQRRIFDPFFTTRPIGSGTGLGLSVAHAIVARHGGNIDLTSTLGQGSTFTVFLPLKYKPAN